VEEEQVIMVEAVEEQEVIYLLVMDQHLYRDHL
jgi:hypothetical protein